MPEFIEGFSESRVHSLGEIVEFNERHKELALPERQCDCPLEKSALS